MAYDPKSASSDDAHKLRKQRRTTMGKTYKDDPQIKRDRVGNHGAKKTNHDQERTQRARELDRIRHNWQHLEEDDDGYGED